MKLVHAVLCGLLVTTTLVPGRVHAAPTTTADTTTYPAAEPFAAEIEAFEQADQKTPPPPGAALFVGSSSIRLWTTLAQDFAETPVINRGFGGSQIEDSTHYADRIVIPYKPRMIVLFAGGNDLNAGKTPEQVLKDFQAFVDKAHTALPATRIVYISINPSVARWPQEEKTLATNRLIEKWIQGNNSQAEKLSYIDSHSRLLGADGKPQPTRLRTDGLHLNAEGYKAWTAIVKPQILALWETDKK